MNENEIRYWIELIDFKDRRAAYRCYQRLDLRLPTRPEYSGFLSHLSSALAGSANPDQVLVSFERFIDSARLPQQLIAHLATSPRLVEVLVTVFAGSKFLTEILLRNPDYFQQLADFKRLAQFKEPDRLDQEAWESISGCTSTPERMDALRRFQRLELFRIGTCDLLDLLDLPSVTFQLSNLADSLVRVCLSLSADLTGTRPDGFFVIGMGKLGGEELNYSSDIDLLFLATSDAENYRRLGERLIDMLARVTEEGFLYRVDMRLRPWGTSGALVSSIEGYLSYLRKHARMWEKQALLKARIIAGNTPSGLLFLQRARPELFTADREAMRSDVHAMKQRTEAKLRQQGRSWGEVKLGEGSIRDVEFVTQYLQLACGADEPSILSNNTLQALSDLNTSVLLAARDYHILKDGYIFLRTIEHYLQMMDYQQTYTLPSDPESIKQLARRLGFLGPAAGEQFLARFQQHCLAIREVYLRLVGRNGMEETPGLVSIEKTPDVDRHLARMDPSYTTTFTREEIKRHALLAESLATDHLAEVDAARLNNNNWRVAIIAYDYPGELSIICGLLLVYDFDIIDGDVFTYEPINKGNTQAVTVDARKKIVDVFTVRAAGEISPEVWLHYAEDLEQLLRLMDRGNRREARGQLAKRVGLKLSGSTNPTTTLYPIEIEIDNTASEHYTVLRIYAQDTIGFLYEFTNSLAFYRIYIERVTVDSIDNRVFDTLYVTDEYGHKITSPYKQRELRAAIVLIKHFTHLLPNSANPEAALLQFRAFIGKLFQQSDWLDEFVSLDRPEVLDALAQLLGVSNFLWEDFLRMQYANLFPVVRDVEALKSAKSKTTLQTELEAEMHSVGAEGSNWRSALNAFKDREMFRVDMRNILGYNEEFEDFSKELTNLAEVIVDSAYRFCLDELRVLYGSPQLENGLACPLAVCALGKCGGRELGYASDIELMFVYGGKGFTTGPRVISSTEFYEKFAQAFLSTIQARREGIFQIDLQLRPYGKAGSMAVSLDAFRRYFAPLGPAWAYERQALVKLRPISGSPEFGQQITALRDEFIYMGEPFDVTSMRAMRERQVRHLVTGGTINAKYSPGGLLDVEYLIQGLQISNGHKDPALRATNSRDAMAALAEHGILAADDHARLRKSYTFLRWLIDTMRVVRGNAKDLTIHPFDSEEFKFLARRLRYGSDTTRLREELERFTQDVLRLNTRLLG